MFEVKEYINSAGKSPYADWVADLRDQTAQVKILRQTRRMALGNFGDVKPVGNGVSETKINYGPGYRVYHAKVGNQLVILLCGGDKSTQAKDIKQAKQHLQDFKNRSEVSA